VGTTDVRHDCDPWAARPDAGELRYLLEEARALFPAVALAPELVRSAYTGVRPLLASTKSDAEAISRRHAVIDHGTRGGPAGLYSVAGGKLSTYRPLAMEVLRRIGRSPEVVRAVASGSSGPALPGHLPPAITDHLERYGAAAAAIARRGAEIVCEHAGAVVGEVEHAVKNEGATSVADVLMRRTGIAWHTCRGLCCHAGVAGLMAEMLGWDSLETERHVATYEREVARHLPAWDEIVAESG
jgi:glycerol-3-phosphate dehydrogenase